MNTGFPFFLMFSSYISLLESIHMISLLLLLYEAKCLWASTRRELHSGFPEFQNETPATCLKTLPATRLWNFADRENVLLIEIHCLLTNSKCLHMIQKGIWRCIFVCFQKNYTGSLELGGGKAGCQISGSGRLVYSEKLGLSVS